MELSSLQVCMDTSNWLQEKNGTNSSSSPSGDMITCSRPLETRLRPPTDQPIKCPRCDSARTKFCYYNNYSLSQPRYFCKTCRRYWTKGGSLRNIPVGGGCRKNKRVTASKKQNEKPSNHCHSHSTSSPHHPTGLHLSFPDVQFSHLSDLLGNSAILGNTSFMEIGGGGGGGGGGYNAMLENSGRQQNQYFMESKFDEILGNTRSHDFMGINDSGLVDGLGDFDNHPGFNSFQYGFCSSAGVSSFSEMEPNQRVMVPFEGTDNASEIKPTKLLSLDLQDHGCNSDVGKDSIGYLDNIGSWNAVMHGYGSSATIL